MKIKTHHLLLIALVGLVIFGTIAWAIKHKGESDPDKLFAKALKLCQEDSIHYFGLSESQATALADKEKRDYRVVERDGVGGPTTADFRSDRLNFEVQKDIVTKVDCY